MCVGSSNVRYLRNALKAEGRWEETDVQILEHLCKPERIHVIDQSAIDAVNIVESSKSHGCGHEFVEGVNRASRTVQVLRVSGRSAQM
jgi:TRAP-type uncharacterized transport system substrate-binding protein